LQALNRQTGAPRFDDALSTLLQRNLEYRFDCSQRIALIYRNRRLFDALQKRQKSALLPLRYLKFSLAAHQSATRTTSFRHDARTDATRTFNVPQIKREAFAVASCSTKRPDRDEDLMKMRRARERFRKARS
jgi:hypothetical protein